MGTRAGPDPGLSLSRAPVRYQRRAAVVAKAEAARMLSTILESMGHEVRTVHDGPSTLELVESYHRQVVLLDIGLSGMDGYQVARELRRREALRGVLLVVLTGYGQQDDRRLSRESGFDHHLVKPVDSRAIQQLIAAV